MAKQTFTTGQVLTAAQMTSLQQTAMGGGSTTAKTASYVLVAADAGTVVQMNAAGATTITVNTALFAAGDTVQIQNVGAGVCTVTAGTATVSTSATLALKQYDAGSLYFNSTSAAIFFAVDAADGMANVLTTTGDMVYSSSGTTAARLGIGSSAQVLTVASGIPSWATPASGGGMTLLSTTSLTGASTTISSINQTYQHLYVIVYGVTNATADGQTVIRVNSEASIYYGTNIRDTTLGTTGGGGITFMQGTRTSVTNINSLYFLDYADLFSSERHLVWGIGYSTANTAFQTFGGLATASTISSLYFFNTGGNFSTGTVEVWGIK